MCAASESRAPRLADDREVEAGPDEEGFLPIPVPNYGCWKYQECGW